MKHYELNVETNQIESFDVVEIKCRRDSGDRATHWTTPEGLCQSAAEAVSRAESVLQVKHDRALSDLNRFRTNMAFKVVK